MIAPKRIDLPTLLPLAAAALAVLAALPGVTQGAAPLYGLLGLFGLLVLLCLLAIRRALRQALAAVEALCAGARPVHSTCLSRLPEVQRLVGHVAGMAGALHSAETENLRLQQTLLQAQEQERNRLGRTLHDDLGQYVAGIRAQAGLFALLADDPQAVRGASQRLEQHCQALQQGFHALVRDLYPVMLDELSLEQAVLQLAAQRSAAGIDCRVGFDARLPEPGRERKLQLYRLLQEALTNVVRHAGARHVRLRVRRRGADLCLSLRDDGHGRPAAGQGVGLRSMSERARGLGGELHYRGRPGCGWTLYLRVPLEEANA